MAGVQRVDAVKKFELPNWSHRVWQATAQLVPIALNEVKIRQVNRHHHKLDELSALRDLDNQRLSAFEKLVRGAVEEILRAGNPLNEGSDN